MRIRITRMDNEQLHILEFLFTEHRIQILRCDLFQLSEFVLAYQIGHRSLYFGLFLLFLDPHGLFPLFLFFFVVLLLFDRNFQVEWSFNFCIFFHFLHRMSFRLSFNVFLAFGSAVFLVTCAGDWLDWVCSGQSAFVDFWFFFLQNLKLELVLYVCSWNFVFFTHSNHIMQVALLCYILDWLFFYCQWIIPHVNGKLSALGQLIVIIKVNVKITELIVIVLFLFFQIGSILTGLSWCQFILLNGFLDFLQPIQPISHIQIFSTVSPLVC